MIFNIYETNFNDNVINKEINNNLLVYDYYYSLFNQSINKFPISDTTYWDIFYFLNKSFTGPSIELICSCNFIEDFICSLN